MWIECGLPFRLVPTGFDAAPYMSADSIFSDEEYYAAWDAHNLRVTKDTFCGRGLNQPGTQIELENGEKYLIGDIAPTGGWSEDNGPFQDHAVVLRYRVLLTL